MSHFIFIATHDSALHVKKLNRCYKSFHLWKDFIIILVIGIHALLFLHSNLSYWLNFFPHIHCWVVLIPLHRLLLWALGSYITVTFKDTKIFWKAQLCIWDLEIQIKNKEAVSIPKWLVLGRFCVVLIKIFLCSITCTRTWLIHALMKHLLFAQLIIFKVSGKITLIHPTFIECILCAGTLLIFYMDCLPWPSW